MSRLSDLGVAPIVNARGHLTTLGGAVLSDRVRDAMEEASRVYVDLPELQRRAGKRIAEISGNEAAVVCPGAAAGVLLSVLACCARDEASIANWTASANGHTPTVAVARMHRLPIDAGLRLASVDLVEFGNALTTTGAHLEHSIVPSTVAVLWVAGSFLRADPLRLEEVVDICHRRRIPLIVDAAAQLPPVENLSAFTRAGASLVVFSAGKAMQGPQNGGIVVGEKALIEAIDLWSSPNATAARPLKTTKEVLMGTVAAVEGFIALDHDAQRSRHEEIVSSWVDALANTSHLVVRRAFPNVGGQPVPRASVMVNVAAPFDGAALVDALLASDPAVAVELDLHSGEVSLCPDTIQDGEAGLVADAVIAAVEQLAQVKKGRCECVEDAWGEES